ncbi:D-serine/D-alanine/glycine transporter [Cutibacterium acnes JCM 18918]|nr:D-serine/D-alanine/glycine transporter [Cutibacterium acnes JCM 18918]
MSHMDSATQATTPTEGPTEEPQLQRGLKNRHLQLIAIGGAIGTGLFLGSGKTISLAGPSILLVYLIIGAVLFFVMRAMGELLLSNLPTSLSPTSQQTSLAPAPGSTWGGHIGCVGSS